MFQQRDGLGFILLPVLTPISEESLMHFFQYEIPQMMQSFNDTPYW